MVAAAMEQLVGLSRKIVAQVLDTNMCQTERPHAPVLLLSVPALQPSAPHRPLPQRHLQHVMHDQVQGVHHLHWRCSVMTMLSG